MFRKSTPETRSTQGTGSSSGMAATFSVLGADLSVKGDLSATADLHIDGSVEGDITCAALVQGEKSTVTGTIKAQSARLSGTVHGSIEAGELVILKSARIHGDVTYDALTIEQGAQVDGKFAHRLQLTEETTLALVS